VPEPQPAWLLAAGALLAGTARYLRKPERGRRG